MASIGDAGRRGDGGACGRPRRARRTGAAVDETVVRSETEVYRWDGPKAKTTILGTMLGTLVLTDRHLLFLSTGGNDPGVACARPPSAARSPGTWPAARPVGSTCRRSTTPAASPSPSSRWTRPAWPAGGTARSTWRSAYVTGT